GRVMADHNHDHADQDGPQGVFRWLTELKGGLVDAVADAVRDGMDALKNLGPGRWQSPPAPGQGRLDIDRDIKDEWHAYRSDDQEQKRINFLGSLGGIVPFMKEWAEGDQKLLDMQRAWQEWTDASKPEPPPLPEQPPPQPRPEPPLSDE